MNEETVKTAKTKKVMKTKSVKGKLYKKDIKAVIKLIDFDPNAESSKFLTAIRDFSDAKYYKLRALEILRDSLTDKGDNKQLITAIRLLMLAIRENQESK